MKREEGLFLSRCLSSGTPIFRRGLLPMASVQERRESQHHDRLRVYVLACYFSNLSVSYFAIRRHLMTRGIVCDLRGGISHFCWIEPA